MVWPMTFLSLRNLFLFVSVSVHQLTLFEYLIISYQLFYEMTQLVIIMVSFNIGTRTPLQFSGVFKPSRILFTTAGYFYPSDQYFIATSANWLDMTGPNSPYTFFLYLFLQIYLNHLLHCSPYLIGSTFLHLEPSN